MIRYLLLPLRDFLLNDMSGTERGMTRDRRGMNAECGGRAVKTAPKVVPPQSPPAWAGIRHIPRDPASIPCHSALGTLSVALRVPVLFISAGDAGQWPRSVRPSRQQSVR